jgi:hypothetical protein
MHTPPRRSPWLLVAALVVACSGAPVDLDASTDDAPDAEFNPCGRPCPAGEVCRSLRCVPLPDGATDVTVDRGGDGASVDVGEGFDGPTAACCPIDRFTTCGCVRVGGTMQTGRACRQVCGEGFPEFWRMSTDVNGCPVWLSSGLSCRDAGDDDALDASDEASSGGATDLGIMQ